MCDFCIKSNGPIFDLLMFWPDITNIYCCIHRKFIREHFEYQTFSNQNYMNEQKRRQLLRFTHNSDNNWQLRSFIWIHWMVKTFPQVSFLVYSYLCWCWCWCSPTYCKLGMWFPLLRRLHSKISVLFSLKLVYLQFNILEW